ncbi:hypothetical protein M8J76_009272 [Diaphorina citri]|nr:hypothetical protein M8J75_002855 [Diaphorina citri]KAI5749678.1 hypothetical protein M8J76_009272 [Diaphorina citri]
MCYLVSLCILSAVLGAPLHGPAVGDNWAAYIGGPGVDNNGDSNFGDSSGFINSIFGSDGGHLSSSFGQISYDSNSALVPNVIFGKFGTWLKNFGTWLKMFAIKHLLGLNVEEIMKARKKQEEIRRYKETSMTLNAGEEATRQVHGANSKYGQQPPDGPAVGDKWAAYIGGPGVDNNGDSNFGDSSGFINSIFGSDGGQLSSSFGQISYDSNSALVPNVIFGKFGTWLKNYVMKTLLDGPAVGDNWAAYIGGPGVDNNGDSNFGDSSGFINSIFGSDGGHLSNSFGQISYDSNSALVPNVIFGKFGTWLKTKVIGFIFRRTHKDDKRPPMFWKEIIDSRKKPDGTHHDSFNRLNEYLKQSADAHSAELRGKNGNYHKHDKFQMHDPPTDYGLDDFFNAGEERDSHHSHRSGHNTQRTHRSTIPIFVHRDE